MTVAQLAEVLSWLPGHQRYLLSGIQPSLPEATWSTYSILLIDKIRNETIGVGTYEQAAQLLLVALT